jgi:outer membrane protein OmpA-like peptidoglycan-associated protein
MNIYNTKIKKNMTPQTARITQTVRGFILFVVFSLCFANAQGNLFSQTIIQKDTIAKFYFGGYTGYNLNMQFGNFTEIDPNCPTCVGSDYGNYGLTVGSGFAIGGLFEYPLYKKLNGNILKPENNIAPMSLGLRVGYSNLSANYKVEAKIGNVIAANGNVTDGISAHILETDISVLSFSPYFAANLVGNLVGNIGLNIGYMLTSGYNQREELVSPAGVLYYEPNNPENHMKRVRNRYDNQTIPDVSALQVGLGFGVGYHIPLGRHSFLVPEISYNFNFTDIAPVLSKHTVVDRKPDPNNPPDGQIATKREVVNDGSWKASALQIGVAFKFPSLSYPPEEPIIPEIFYQRDTTIEYKIGITAPEIVLKNRTKTPKGVDTLITENYVKYMPQQAELTANLSYYAMDKGQRSDVVAITVEEFETTEGFPLLPIVYFKDGDADLTQTKMRLLTAGTVSNFDYNNLKSDIFELYHNTLNIIGKRLKDNPRLEITIAGYSSGSGADAQDRNIWQKRANVVRDYFVNVWEIESKRLKVEQRTDRRNPAPGSVNDVTEENQKVEMFANYDILRPIVLSEIEKIANPPQIVFEMNGGSEVGLSNYSLVLSQGGNKLRDFSETLSASHFNANKSWFITEEPLPMLERPVEALLTVRDNSNQTVTKTQNFDIQQKTIRSKRALVENDMRIERYSLVLFAIDSDALTAIHQRVLDEVKKSIQPNSELYIYGYADRTGDEQHNENLARRRCERVNSHINPGNRINAVMEAVGSKELIYNNDIPEGRAFSRTVKIEIRTPIK